MEETEEREVDPMDPQIDATSSNHPTLPDTSTSQNDPAIQDNQVQQQDDGSSCDTESDHAEPDKEEEDEQDEEEQEEEYLSDILLRNAKIASYRDEEEPCDHFTIFLKLPAEIRVMIWQHAVSVPRIVEVEETSSGTTGENFTQWRCKNRSPPPLLATCVESRKEALEAYMNVKDEDGEEIMECLAGPFWIRFEWDILHLKNMDFSDGEKDFAALGFPGVGERPEPRDTLATGVGQHLELSGMAPFFRHTKALAINRELFLSTWDHCEAIISDYFPNLHLLIILIDDDTPIEEMWDVRRGDFSRYEGDEDAVPIVHNWHERRPRSAFVNHSTGPFTEIGSINANYRDWVHAHVSVCVGEMESQNPDYEGPKVEVLGCHLPEDKMIPMCGRTPYDW
ncbi:uncharacterized protein PAC_14369 [Phialocephala subalpina]|uniref:2EXR domain-containing protein n=1 Tax=Phialocephala subalpina TaxID=576137 RepID=A0A1L7XHG7_9HELO|nr:uncharacterized protein PAC_14369 [Phialocephala subalpina]